MYCYGVISTRLHDATQMLTTLQFLELFLRDIHECVEELLPGVAALLAEVIPEGSAQILVYHPEDKVVLFPEDAPGMVVAGDLSRDISVLGCFKKVGPRLSECIRQSRNEQGQISPNLGPAF